MEKITIKGRFADSAIFTGERINNLPHYIPSKGVYIITDGNVNAIYRGRFPECPTFVVEPGEASKSIQTVVKIYRWLLDSGADRSSFIVAIGGGVICDIAGFVASTFMRGVKFGFVATSLLAQVDASVGGEKRNRSRWLQEYSWNIQSATVRDLRCVDANYSSPN